MKQQCKLLAAVFSFSKLCGLFLDVVICSNSCGTSCYSFMYVVGKYCSIIRGVV